MPSCSLLSLLLTIIATTALVRAQDSASGMLMTCQRPGQFALTFDDGPSDYTPQLLATLDREHIPVTFFVLGVQADNATLAPYLKDAYTRGHQIATHTYDHAHLNNLTEAQIRDQMTRNDRAIRNVIGASPSYMRPPYGECNTTTQQILQSMGYLIVQWNLDSSDWRYADKSDAVKARVTQNFVKELNKPPGAPPTDEPTAAAAESMSNQPPPTRRLHARAVTAPAPATNPALPPYISLQHDIQPFSVDQTPAIIQAIRAKGYQFVTVAECAGSMKKPMYTNAPDGVFQGHAVPGNNNQSGSGVSKDQAKSAASNSIVGGDTRWTMAVLASFMIALCI